MKLKKIMSVLLASVMFMSIGAVPAFAANTKDTPFHFYWEGIDRTNWTEDRVKYDNTPMYIKITAYTLPYNGFLAGTRYYSGGWHNASKDSYKINDYSGHTIRSNATSRNMYNTEVHIRSYYLDYTYNWGTAEGVWSPDTYNPQNYTSLN